MEDLATDMEKQMKRKEETEAKMRGMAEDIKQGQVALDEIRESLAMSDLYKRNIEDNIRYRRQKAEIAALNERIRKKEEDCNVNTNEALDFDIDKLTKAIEQRKRKVYIFDEKHPVLSNRPNSSIKSSANVIRTKDKLRSIRKNWPSR